MSRSKLNRVLILFAIVGTCMQVNRVSLADNWPQFRGANFNGISPTKLPVKWSDADGKVENVQWKVAVGGEGWSQPVIWDDQVILTAAVPIDAENLDAAKPQPYTGGGGQSRTDLMKTTYSYDVFCLDSKTGKELWRRSVKKGQPPMPRHSTNTYATETPITDGERIYAYFGMNGVYCLDMDGNVLWEKDLGVYEMRADWGTSSSPVLADDKVFIQVDNEVQSFLVALDAKTGDEVWRVDRDEKSQYSSPMIWENSIRKELICGGMVYRSYDLATGKLLWKLDMSKGRSSATPVALNDRLYIGTELRNRGGSDDGGGRLFSVKPGGSGDITPRNDASASEFIQWRIDRSDIQMASPTICAGKLYLFQRRSSQMQCIDVETGETTYRKRMTGARAFWASPWTDGEHVYALSADGVTYVLAAGDDFKIVATNPIDQQAWGTPALSDGRIYLRTVDHLYCIADANSQTEPAEEKSLSDKSAPQPWNQWRGPERNGTWQGELPTSLADMKVAWQKPLSPSYSGPVTDGETVFTTETVDESFERVTAIDLASGDVKWTARWDGAIKVPPFAAANGSWIKSTPALSDDALVVVGIRDELVCLDPADGTKRWQIDLADRFQSRRPNFGAVCSPIIDGEAVYVQGGGATIKVSLADGSTIWQTLGGEEDDDAFSSPIIATIGDVRQLVVQTRTKLCGVSLDNGSVLWSQPIAAYRNMNVLTPTIIGDSVFTAAHSGKSQCFDIAKSGDAWQVNERWNQKIQAYMSSPVVDESTIYIHAKNQRLNAMDANSGEILWTGKPMGKYQSFVRNDKRILVLDAKGELLSIKPNRNELEIVERRKVADDSWAHLGVFEGGLIVRDLNALTIYSF